jgi:hypothetical protein
VEDKRRGLYSDEALRSRLSSRVKNGHKDISAPVIQLETLTSQNISELLHRLVDVHAAHYNYNKTLKPSELQEFMQEVVNRLGAEKFLTPPRSCPRFY